MSMINLLSNPAWQGIGVIAATVIGFIGFYYVGKNKLWLYLSMGIVVFILGLSLGTRIEASPDREAIEASPNREVVDYIAVDSTKQWQETGVSVNQSDTLTARVIAGKWTMGRKKLSEDDKKLISSNPRDTLWKYGFSETSGEQVDQYQGTCNDCPINTIKPGSLIGKITNLDDHHLMDTFDLGNGKEYKAKFNGKLDLRMNDADKGLWDNSGILLVKIDVSD
ncbi:MAG: hypothetical protein AAGG51_22255 [Cyanobacteria bacterium P01_G01_bin.54]